MRSLYCELVEEIYCAAANLWFRGGCRFKRLRLWDVKSFVENCHIERVTIWLRVSTVSIRYSVP